MNSRIVNLPHELKPNAAAPHQTLVVEATAKSVSALVGYAAQPVSSKYVEIQVTGGTIRATDDGATAPAAAVGFLRADGYTAVLTVEAWLKLGVIIASGTPAIAVQGLKL